MESVTEDFKNIADNIIESQRVKQYVELGKLAQDLIPLFTTLQNDLDHQDSYYIKIANTVLEYYGENLKLEKPGECNVFNMYVGADPAILSFYTFSDLPIMTDDATLGELKPGCELILTLIIAYYHKCIKSIDNFDRYHAIAIEYITRGVATELCLHKFLLSEEDDKSKLDTFTAWMLNNVKSILGIMYSYANKAFNGNFLPLFMVAGQDTDETEDEEKYGILVFHYKK